MEFFRNSLVSILTVLGLASLVLFILFFSGHSLADEYSDNMNDGKSWAEANKERVNESGKSSTEADSATPVNPTMTSDDTEEFYNRSRADLPSLRELCSLPCSLISSGPWVVSSGPLIVSRGFTNMMLTLCLQSDLLC